MLRILRNREEIASFLRRQPLLHAYELGDLDDFFWPRTSWFGWEEDGRLESVFLLYSGDPECPTLLALADRNREASLQLAVKLIPKLPDRLHAHLSPLLEKSFQDVFSIRRRASDLKMGLEPGQLKEAPPVEGTDLIRLTPGDVERVERFYTEAFPDNWFDPRMLETGHYLALERKGKLRAVAGVHVYSPRYRVAALGNIATHPESRGRGMGRLLTASLCEKLFETVDLIGLNVRSGNDPAIRCYQKIGFVEQSRFLELELVRGRAPYPAGPGRA